MPDARLLSIQTGKIAPLGPDHVLSGFVKTPRTGAVKVMTLGLEGDEIADLSVHGGVDKAVYAYAASRYPAWAAQFPALRFRSGAMGENLTVEGMDESDVCVGDVHAIGSALLQVCQPRQPCFKFALRHGDKLLPKAMVRNGYSGWYYRVAREGVIAPGDAVKLENRSNPDFALSRLIQIIYHGAVTREELIRMTEMNGLAAQWRRHAQEELAKR